MEDKEHNVQYFLDLIKRSRQGKFKIYIGMSAGVGKTYRMLQEAHILLRNGIDVKLGYIETHDRTEVEELLPGLPIISRRKIFYKSKQLEEMDLQAILNLRPEVVIVDELAHTNIPGSKNEKRWQDVMEIIASGINVISAVNIQHIEGLNEEVRKITGKETKERIPDIVLGRADEVVNLDFPADELITRLKEGKIYSRDKIEPALTNFFKAENLLQLRQLALREVVSQVERKVEREIHNPKINERFLACISSNEKTARIVIRKTARLANFYGSKWYVLYVQTMKENSDKIPLDKQRYLINNFKLATQMGAEVIQVKNNNVVLSIVNQAVSLKISTICIGRPHISLPKMLLSTRVLKELLNKVSLNEIDIVILS
ncbi:MAG: sensor protein KdpD [Omnitrophica WOR_2 bacterium]|jgi:two-component system sensor histidine kinase KdpD